jgi:Right handed beta helix region
MEDIMKTARAKLLGEMLLLLMLFAQAPHASATVTYYVGSCMAGSYPNISDALAATVPPDVVKVCPGTYPDQVFITKPLTLEGISTSSSDQVVITQPTGGLSGSCRNVGDGVQLCVTGAGSVSITNITVDGTGTTGATGIYYKNSSGTLNHVQTRFQENGIYVEGGADTVTIENSDLNNFTGYGIFGEDTSSSHNELTLKIEGNTVAPTPGATAAIRTANGASLTLTGNIIRGPAPPATGSCSGLCFGVKVTLPSAGSISGNTITDSNTAGIALLAGNTSTISVTSNTIFNIGGDGIQLQSGVTTVPVQKNIISRTENGINFKCNANKNVSANTISAVDDFAHANLPSGLAAADTYYNLAIVFNDSSCK